MNAAMVKALALDAIYQVLDNKVFRVLLVLVLIPILVTFVIGFREEEMVILFGFWRWTYPELIEAFGGPADIGDFDFQGAIVSGLVTLFVDFAGGKFGIMLAISATAFFVPRMLEKGSADVYFHKPLNRFVLFLSRYFAGLIFIAVVTAVAVAGMYLGLLFVSGYNDPGILWAALTMTYLFGLVHCVSMLVGVMTRSTVAAILVTLIFFLANGCLQWSWIQKEQAAAYGAARFLGNEEVDPEDPLAEEGAALDRAGEESGGSAPLILRILLRIFDTAHYVLPKTTDAGYITDKLRASVERGLPFEDKESGLTLWRLPDEVSVLDAAAAQPPFPGAQELLGEPVFAAGKDGAASRLVVWSRPSVWREVEGAGKTRRFPESLRQTASNLADAIVAELGLEESAVVVEDRPLEERMARNPLEPPFRPASSYQVDWKSGDRAFHLVLVAAGGRFHALELSAPASASDEERAAWFKTILDRSGIRNDAGDETWYVDKLSWNAELKYNIAFSIGSSLAFAVVMLLLGAWKLSRLDF